MAGWVGVDFAPTGLGSGWGCTDLGGLLPGDVCLSDAAHGFANFSAGLGDFVISTATGGLVHIHASYCGPGLGASTTIGWLTGLSESLLLSLGPEARATGDLLRLSAEESWGDISTLEDHFLRHGADFGATSAEDYASKASEFFQRSQANGLPTKIDADGVIRVYDPATSTFGAYNADGTTRTFFKPTSPTYWDRQPGSSPWTG